MANAFVSVPSPRNEPVLSYAPGTPERRALTAQLERMSKEIVEITPRIGGRNVETGRVGEVIRSPRHPYTQGLLASTVRGELRGQRIEAIPGSPPDLAELPAGFAFAPRCKHAREECMRAVPEASDVGGGHTARCVLLRRAA